MKNFNKHSGYSIIISLLIIGFLLVLTTGILTLVLNELKDNRAMGDYIKAYAGAESAQELALLKIKEKGYAYYDKIDHDINNRSIVLADNPLDISPFMNFKGAKDVFISYDIKSKTDLYSGTLSLLQYDIIPLFYVDDSLEHKITNITLNITGTESNLAWNIIGESAGISGTGSNTTGVVKNISGGEFNYQTKTIDSFLTSSNSNYLVLLNTGDTDISYNLISGDDFTKPEITIISSAQVGKYRQNLSTKLNNTEFLNMLKYSIYSN